MRKVFTIASVSSNANSFGLYGHILVARDGEAWEVGLNYLNKRTKGTQIVMPLDNGGGPRWALIGAEIPKLLPKAPKAVLREVFAPQTSEV